MRRPASGFSLVEVVVASALLGGVFVATMTAVAATKAGRLIEQQRTIGHRLAQDLMEEILAQAYREGDALGLDGESDFAGRTAFDDIDDYAGLQETNLRAKDGSPLPGTSGYTREAEVHWVNPDDPTQVVPYDSGVKRVLVRVAWGGRPVAELVTLRTSARPMATSLFEQPQW